MASLKILNRSGQEVGSYDFDPAELAPRINKQLLHDAVVMYQRNLRLGTAKTKTRGEVSGSTRKLYRQKGTGRARAGSIRSGTRRGGGHIFAKSPRDWTFRMPRKALQAATRMALASKIRDDAVVLIDDLKFDAPKTKEMAAVLEAVGCAGQTVLVATTGYDLNVYKSARNIDRVCVSPVAELNAYTVLKPRRLVLTTAALDAFRQRGGEKANSASKSSEKGES